MDKQSLIETFYLKKDYDSIIENVSNLNSNYEKSILARVYLEKKDYLAAAGVYKDADMLYEYGRCCLLLGELEQTKEIWKYLCNLAKKGGNL